MRYPSAPIGNATSAVLLLAYLVLAMFWARLTGGWVPAGLIWPASGAALALVLLRGIGVWPLIFAVAFAHAILTLDAAATERLIDASVLAAAAMAEPLIAACLIWRLTGEAYAERARPFALAMLVAAPAAAFLAAIPPVLLGELPVGLIAAKAERGPIAAWYSAALAGLMGMMALTPPIWIWARYPRLRVEPRRALELAALMVLVGVVLAMPTAAQARYLLVAIHIAIALRFSLKWCATTVALTSLVYLALGTAGLQTVHLRGWYVVFLSNVAFVIILNLATYVTALLHAEVRQRARQMADLAHALSNAEEGERRRIAQILHDRLQQVLVAAKLALVRDPERARRRIDEAIEAARALTVELHPPVLDDQGLATGLRWLGWHIHELTGLEVEVEADATAEPSSPDVRAFLFQATRELLMNVAKHARTRKAWVRLRREGGQVRIEVVDHGLGCDPKRAQQMPGSGSHYGLPAIRQRLELLGGSFEMVAERGCRVVLTMPADA